MSDNVKWLRKQPYDPHLYDCADELVELRSIRDRLAAYDLLVVPSDKALWELIAAAKASKAGTL